MSTGLLASTFFFFTVADTARNQFAWFVLGQNW